MPKHAQTKTDAHRKADAPEKPDRQMGDLPRSEESPQNSIVVSTENPARTENPERGKHGRAQNSKKPALSPRQKKSRRMRRVLIVVVILLIVLIGALAFSVWQLLDETQTVASQQIKEQQSSQEIDAIPSEGTKDADNSAVKKTEVPNLVLLMGLAQDEAIAALARGATVSGTREVNEEGNPVKTSVSVALTDEPSDTRSGTPTVYLGLDEEGLTVMAGYSAATASLGYGSLSFVDAVKNEKIVEKTLAEAGVVVEPGAVVLPANKAEYSTYATDGTTLEKENCSFSGTAAVNGAEEEWSAVLMYDYKLANASGNLADTIRQIYIYLNA